MKSMQRESIERECQSKWWSIEREVVEEYNLAAKLVPELLNEILRMLCVETGWRLTTEPVPPKLCRANNHRISWEPNPWEGGKGGCIINRSLTILSCTSIRPLQLANFFFYHVVSTSLTTLQISNPIQPMVYIPPFNNTYIFPEYMSVIFITSQAPILHYS